MLHILNKKHINKRNINKRHILPFLFLPLCLTLQAHRTPGGYLDGNTVAWGQTEYTDEPWVFNASRPYFVTRGLENRHLSLWASHGRYYNADQNVWKWQRPYLFGTTEDLFTQTIVVPYLIPMLQNAGAIVFTPRERDWQRHEVVVDNDDIRKSSLYQETVNGKKWKSCDSLGFAARQALYEDGENPFRDGTTRVAKATRKKRCSEIDYRPDLPEDGKYAVYVTYPSLPKSVPDAHYTVWHKGRATEFTVNQRMGSGTWVYLGTFDFDKGCSEANRVVLTNQSAYKGVVTADAVRFGGGMGNIARGDTVSGLPRCLEGARYYAQWAGAPYAVYGGRKGENDYADDINTRSLMTNWLGGGSVYMPALEGKQVPLELSLALHSDAGYARDGVSTIGALTICTTNYNDERLNSGISRQTSKDFARALLKNLVRDLRHRYGAYNERYLWDRNYSETRLPEVPSAIVEMLSHQNFPDMKIAQDPMGKFTIARSIYKTILRYVTSNHGKTYSVQPLPPTRFAVELTQDGQAKLTWSAQTDRYEPTAAPTGYVLYTAEGEGGFNNGQLLKSTACQVKLDPGKVYSFKVSAVNAGGESFCTETLSARYVPSARNTVLVVNNFHRLAAPQVLDNDSLQGFDMDIDPGVTYGRTVGWCGRQTVFDRKKMGTTLGLSGTELEGKFIAGNDFNYTVEHARAIAAAGNYNIASCSAETVATGQVRLSKYQAVDLINGLERYDGYTPDFYKAFTPIMQEKLREYTQGGGGLLVSGSYNGSDMQSDSEKDFLAETLKLQYVVPDSVQPTAQVKGLGLEFGYYHQLNDSHYAATHPEVLQPSGTAICAMQYATGLSAAVAYRGDDYRSFTMGFPFECITDPQKQASLMKGILGYILKQP